jgi:hypothetical protein
MTSSSLLLPNAAGEFRYDDPSHTYSLGGKILPSITGILKACRYVDTTHYTPEARTRGSHVHLAIKFLNKGTLDWASVRDEYIGYVLAYQKLVKDWEFLVELFEVPMFHPILLFGGTPDLVGTVFGGVRAIIELKTGPVMKWTALQTIAQEMLLRATEPSVRYRRWGVTLNADGTYSKPKEFKEYERDEAVFRMLNTAVQVLGKEKAEVVFEVLNGLSTAEREALSGVLPTLNSVVEHRELYAA